MKQQISSWSAIESLPTHRSFQGPTWEHHLAPFDGDMHASIRSVLDEVKKLGRLPVVTFSAGGIATPADASHMMRMGMDGIFVGSGIFKSDDPPNMADAIVMATALLRRCEQSR